MTDLTPEEVQQIREAMAKYEDFGGIAEEDVLRLCDTVDHLREERDTALRLCKRAEDQLAESAGKVLWRGPTRGGGVPGEGLDPGSHLLAELPDTSPGTEVAVVLTGEDGDG